MTDPIEAILVEARADRAFSCAAWGTGTADTVDSAGVIGELSWGGPSADSGTWWDLASVTKPIVALAVMSLVQSGELTLDDTIGEHLPDYAGTDKHRVSIRQLLTHTAGFPGELPLYRWCASRHEVLDEIRRVPLRYDPGTDVEYTSQGFIVLGLVAEAAAAMPLDGLVEQRVTAPAGMPATRFLLDPAEQVRAAATEDCPWRGRVVQGTVHDENAEVLGGVAGHAGLFSTLADMQTLARALCRILRGDRTAWLAPSTLATMIAPATDRLRLRRCLGWQGRAGHLSSAGDLAGPGTFGHTGFTGRACGSTPTPGGTWCCSPTRCTLPAPDVNWRGSGGACTTRPSAVSAASRPSRPTSPTGPIPARPPPRALLRRDTAGRTAVRRSGATLPDRSSGRELGQVLRPGRFGGRARA